MLHISELAASLSMKLKLYVNLRSKFLYLSTTSTCYERIGRLILWFSTIFN